MRAANVLDDAIAYQAKVDAPPCDAKTANRDGAKREVAHVLEHAIQLRPGARDGLNPSCLRETDLRFEHRSREGDRVERALESAVERAAQALRHTDVARRL